MPKGCEGMPLPFDATMKDLVQSYPQDWLAQFDAAAAAPVSLLNVDLSTISAATDIVLAVGDPPETLLDLNFQSGRAADLSRRLLVYNALLYHRYEVPVHSVVVLLRPAADDAALTGQVRYEARPARGGMAFTFEVVRLWQRPVESILAGGVGTLPLAPLCQVPPGATLEEVLPGIIRQMEQRLTREASPESAAKLLTSAFVLAGMRVKRETLIQLFQGVRAMESTAWDVSMADGARKILLRMGRKRFGPPPPQVEAALQAIIDIDRLEQLSERLLDVTSWQELLDAP
jgi:hypothetical protein